ncbi:MAG: hypothetical protein KF841_11985 [Phycisphaerae bacterium]|nr:hypothetical protein [Phycisphaerae bacterium]
MNSIRTKIAACAICVSVVGMSGCGGDNILSAVSKVLGGQMSQLTAGEILVLNRAAASVVSQFTGLPPVTLTTPQAVAVSNFLQVNELDTIQDLETLARTAQSDPDSVQGWDDLSGAFAGSDFDNDEGEFDPSRLGDLFGHIVSGASGSGSTGLGLETSGSL